MFIDFGIGFGGVPGRQGVTSLTVVACVTFLGFAVPFHSLTVNALHFIAA